MSNRSDDDTMSDDRTQSAGSSTNSIFSQKLSSNQTFVDQEENSALAEEATTSRGAWVANEPKFTPSRFVLRPEEAFTIVTGERDPSVAAREWKVVFPSA